jgi:CubicO group peptidase (beta-lactamase class C family)
MLMEKKFMRKSNWSCVLLMCLGLFIVFHTACAQSTHVQNQDYLSEERLAEKTTVLLNNGQQKLPLQNLEQLKVASVRFGYQYAPVFDSLLNKYTHVTSFNGSSYTGDRDLNTLCDDMKMYNTVIVQLSTTDGITPQIIDFINANQKLKNVIVAVFGNSTTLTKLNDITVPLIWSERLSAVSASYTAQAIFGGVAITQKLTKTYSPKYTSGSGFITAKTRLQYTVPENAGINADNLRAIDNVALEAIRSRATPGCVVLVAKDGKVIFNKAYGTHTYDANALPDKLTDIFDLASVTKISATTMEVMRLYEQGKLSLDSAVSSYIAIARNSNKKDIRVREVMLHQAGFVPYIPFYEKLKPADHSSDSSAIYPTKVADGYYLRKDYYKDVMWPQMVNSGLRTRGQYVYSDLSMYFMKEIVETITSQPLNTYVQEQFYNPLGMQYAGFLPRNRFSRDQIIPTENDTYFRKTLLEGYVHDQGAAMVGGVSGHAGLFSSANDLAILYQMILNRGTYGGVQYFKPETVDMFTAKQSDVSRRGLGFDRWDPEVSKHYPSELASPQTYGHTGYTGTCFWVDTKYNMIYIFLSNRVNPQVSEKLSSLRIRPRIQDVVYQAIQKGL